MKFTRREVLKSAALSGAALASGAIVLPGCGNNVEPAPATDVTVSSGQVSIEVSRFPDLNPKKAGGALTLRLNPPQPSPLPTKVGNISALLVVQWLDGNFIVTDSDCPHKQCPLGYTLADGTTPTSGFGFIECPCHASRFAAVTFQTDDGQQFCAGDVTHAPAATGLMMFPTDFSDGVNLKIDLTRATQNATTTPCATSVTLPPIVAGSVVVPIAMFPQLATVGGQLVGSPMGSPDVLLLIARTSATAVLTTDAACTHLGCPVAYSPNNSDLECPCHGSVFGLDGTVRVGPATQSLKTYAVTFDAAAMTATVKLM